MHIGHFPFTVIVDSDEGEHSPERNGTSSVRTGTKNTPPAETSDIEVEEADDDSDDAGENDAENEGIDKETARPTDGATGRDQAGKAKTAAASTPKPSAVPQSGDTAKRHQWTYEESVNIWKGVQVRARSIGEISLYWMPTCKMIATD